MGHAEAPPPSDADQDRVRRMHALVEAGIAITSELSLERVLQQIVDAARNVVQARYAALGVVAPDGSRLERLVTSGLDPETIARIESFPVGKGVLGVLLEDPKPLRLRDLTRDPRAAGFPPHHPPMHSFLGVPIISRGQVFGSLYLTEKVGAPEFDEEDESLALSLAAQAAVAIQNARLFEETKEQHGRLLRAERLYAIGALAATVGHELRNPLSVINNAAYVLSMRVPRDDPRVARSLDTIRREVRAATQIIEDLLDFSRTRTPQPAAIDAGGLVREALDRVQVPESVHVESVLQPEMPRLFVDPVQAGQVLANLLANAVDAMPGGGDLRIEVSVANGKAMLAVSDTGVGIPEENLPLIFEPLFTTKARGVGLGLALVRRIVEAHNGEIRVVSQEGRGTTFTIALPLPA